MLTMNYLILNIPKEFHCVEMRNYFHELIEQTAFECFHFRHRPQADIVNTICNSVPKKLGAIVSDQHLLKSANSVSSDVLTYCNGSFWNNQANCCFVRVHNHAQTTFVKAYNNKVWVNLEGNTIPYKCYIVNLEPLLNIPDLLTVDTKEFKTRKEHHAETYQINLVNLNNMIEFRPPLIMPNGNVGTTGCHFSSLIKSCQLPASLITKLGLQISKKRQKKYGKVHMDYGTLVKGGSSDCEKISVIYTAKGDLIPNFCKKTDKKPKRKEKVQLELIEEDMDGNEVEEWDRHESFTDDPSNQERNKERSYEPEIEQVWEKGGPGLVFYTDATFWRQQEGDFDEQTTDEWDVDMSGYYGEVGDADSKASASMREIDGLRSGKHVVSVFKKPSKTANKIKGPWKGPETIGKFEAHTKGFGRKVMESQGWKDGDGLGHSSKGIPYAIDNDGKHPSDKKGFGYHGEKVIYSLPKNNVSSKIVSKRQPNQAHLISTVYDDPNLIDSPTSVHQRKEPTSLSHRPHPYLKQFTTGS